MPQRVALATRSISAFVAAVKTERHHRIQSTHITKTLLTVVPRVSKSRIGVNGRPVQDLCECPLEELATVLGERNGTGTLSTVTCAPVGACGPCGKCVCRENLLCATGKPHVNFTGCSCWRRSTVRRTTRLKNVARARVPITPPVCGLVPTSLSVGTLLSMSLVTTDPCVLKRLRGSTRVLQVFTPWSTEASLVPRDSGSKRAPRLTHRRRTGSDTNIRRQRELQKGAGDTPSPGADKTPCGAPTKRRRSDPGSIPWTLIGQGRMKEQGEHVQSTHFVSSSKVPISVVSVLDGAVMFLTGCRLAPSFELLLLGSWCVDCRAQASNSGRFMLCCLRLCQSIRRSSICWLFPQMASLRRGVPVLCFLLWWEKVASTWSYTKRPYWLQAASFAVSNW